MFTGLVADLGTVAAVDAADDGVRLRVTTALAGDLRDGDSIAVNGVCLTAVGADGDGFGADVMHETLRRSSLAEVAPGARVNLELPLRADDRLGGHVVQGHVDGLGAIRAVREEGFARVVTIEADPALLRYVVEKGSIAVDGVSLTVARGRRRRVRGVADPRDARAHDPRRGRSGCAGEPRGRHAGEVRREAASVHAPEPMTRIHTSFATIEEAIEDIRQGKMVVVVDDEDRENEGDLTIAAQFVTPDAINFMAKHARGLICLALTPERCDELGLDLMAAKNESPFETAFTVSVEARDGVTTGISAARPRAHDPGRDRPARARRATSSSPATSSR